MTGRKTTKTTGKSKKATTKTGGNKRKSIAVKVLKTTKTSKKVKKTPKKKPGLKKQNLKKQGDIVKSTRQNTVKKNRATTKRTPLSVDYSSPLIISQELEKQKHLLMWSGVTFFMFLIVILWLYNFSGIFFSAKETNENKDVLSANKINQAAIVLDEKLKQLATDLKTVKNFTPTEENNQIIVNEKKEDKNIFSSSLELQETQLNNMIATGSAETKDRQTTEEIKRLKARLKILEQRLQNKDIE